MWAALEWFPLAGGCRTGAPRAGWGGIGPLEPPGTPPPPNHSSSPGHGPQRPPALGADQAHGAPSRATPTMPGVQAPPPTSPRLLPSPQAGRNRGQSVVCVKSFFILFPQKHLVRGQLLGGSHDTAAGAVRHGTARYGTVRGHYGWHRAQQTRTPSQCSEGAHPASHLPPQTVPGARPPSTPRLYSPLCPPSPGWQTATILGWRPGPAGWATGLRSRRVERRGGGCARAARRAPAGVSVPRAIDTLYKYLQREERRGPGARRRHPQAMHLSSAGRGGGRARGRGSPPWGCRTGMPRSLPPHPPAAGLSPSLGHGQSPLRGTCHGAWASHGDRVLDNKCINLLRAFSTVMD